MTIIYASFLGLGFQVKNLCVMFVFAIVSFMFFSEYQFAVDIVQVYNLQYDKRHCWMMWMSLPWRIHPMV
jgi:hypothetical protein